MEQTHRNRWVILFAGIISNLCIGAVYAWSVFQKPLMSMYKWTPSEASLTFTLSLAMMPIAMIIAGKIQDQKGPKMVVIVGGILYGAGIFFAGYAQSLIHLYLSYGVLGGLGVGAVYACAIANSVKWFPDKKGLASGLIAAGLGLGAVVFAPIASTLIQGYGVMSTFKIWGVGYLVVIIIAAQFLHMPPANYRPNGWTPPASMSGGNSAIDKNWKEMLSDPMFYILLTIYTMGAISGLMIIGFAASIGQEVIKLSAPTAALAVSILALANTFGRIFWGFISDKLGRYVALIGIFLVSAAMMFLLPQVSTFLPFVLVIALVGLCFGGLLGIFPAITGEMFGMKNLGMNYGIMFSAFAVAAIIGPRLAAHFKEITGEYTQAFLIASVISACGVVMAIYARYQVNKRVKQASAACAE